MRRLLGGLNACGCWIARKIRSARRRFFCLLFLALDRIVPKQKNLVILGSWGGKFWGDNAKALYEYISSHPSCGLDAYYYLIQRPADGGGPRCLTSSGWRTWWKLLRARVVVETHSFDTRPYPMSRKKLHVNLWHGVPLKTVALTERGDTAAAYPAPIPWTQDVDVLVAPSRYAAMAMSACWMFDIRKVFLCGQPRNDRLVRRDAPAVDLRAVLSEVPPFNRVILYAPTFRGFRATQFFPFDDFDGERLDAFLAQHKAVMLTRGHVNVPEDRVTSRMERVLPFNSDVCPDVNEVLTGVDVLVTDYSSIYFDFLLLNRSIVFLPYDLEEYREKRGLLVDDYDAWTPGPKPHSFGWFLEALENAFSHPQKYADERQRINALCNYYQGDNSCERIVHMIRKRVGLD